MLALGGQGVFREFLKSEFSEENIEFWLACEDYKKTKSDHLHGKAERIYEEFVQSDAIRQVCIKPTCAELEGRNVAPLRCLHTHSCGIRRRHRHAFRSLLASQLIAVWHYQISQIVTGSRPVLGESPEELSKGLRSSAHDALHWASSAWIADGVWKVLMLASRSTTEHFLPFKICQPSG